ncbi:MAG: hypothetical protein Q8N51_18110 [Gammaproteobacteria bacterium]|nr:hypothetical protein [Gammaproteobacteria bacterium]
MTPGAFSPRRRLLLSLPLLLAGLPARAQPVPRPDLRVGDQWQFAVYDTVPTRVPSRTWIVTAFTPAGIEATENGAPLRLTPDLNVLDSPRQSETNPGLLRFPLEVGKRWRYDSQWIFKPKSSAGTVSMSVEVQARERVSVPAGEFDAFRLFALGKLGGTSPANSVYASETTTTYWYAPAARAIVKSVHHNPYLGKTVVELVSVKRGR